MVEGHYHPARLAQLGSMSHIKGTGQIIGRKRMNGRDLGPRCRPASHRKKWGEWAQRSCLVEAQGDQTRLLEVYSGNGRS